MRHIKEMPTIVRVADVVSEVKGRELPLIHEAATLEQIIRAVIRFEHSRLLYVVDDEKRLTGTISLGLLVRHLFSTSYEPQVHSGRILNIITAETARDIMQKSPIATHNQENVETVLKKMIRSNAKEIPVLDKRKRVIADLKMIDLFNLLLNDTGS
ncbi:MAG: CBS domain-containing protein [Deltaproteobacteria bacterium]|jgi:CBS domain-containing protein